MSRLNLMLKWYESRAPDTCIIWEYQKTSDEADDKR